MVNVGSGIVVDGTSTGGGCALTPANQQLKSPAMAIREIIVLPDKKLRLVSKPVEKITTEVRKLADDMFETMYDAPGIGLAAIQVAQPLRLITMAMPSNTSSASALMPISATPARIGRSPITKRISFMPPL